MPAVLERVSCAGIHVLTDPALKTNTGIVVAFTERGGGMSQPPYASLDLAAHVGDDPARVDGNRTRLLDALGIGRLRDRLTVPEQVHGTRAFAVDADAAGSGAFAAPGGSPRIPATDALLTRQPGVPLMLCFADCVPVVLVAPGPGRAVAVVHAGWRGALGRLPGLVARRLARLTGCGTEDLTAYVGPHIGPCHYPVDAGLVSQFVNTFGSIAAARDRLDLGAVVSATLCEAGVPPSSQVVSGLCTAESTDRFYSYRAEGVTGRHAALACILGPSA
jgi:hypothetical protein